jgi:hypothetical protein
VALAIDANHNLYTAEVWTGRDVGVVRMIKKYALQ